jgi:glucose-6-phosphate isomerase
MAVSTGETAMNNRLIFDFTNLTAQAIGEHGISDARISGLAEKARNIDSQLKQRRNEGGLPYRDLYKQNIAPILAFADKSKKRFENFVNIGIGGSALGAQALHMALNHPQHNLLPASARKGMRFFCADNVDPDALAGIFEVCDPTTTLYNVITKSGSTAETMGAFLLVKEQLEKSVGDMWRDHVVVTTDEKKGDLRKIADTEKLASFLVPDGVGGRFSVLTPVGLLPAACIGIDITGLLAGAADMDHRLESADLLENPAHRYALYHYLLDAQGGKRISVMMPYASGLYGLADWYRQLWAESLGKKYDLDGRIVHVGPTPVKALGVTDQHSQVQLYVEGPFDKVFTILAVGSFSQTLPMKTAYPGTAALDYLDGRSMAELMEAERLGTIYALRAAGRPNMTITFPRINAGTVGQFMFALEAATVFAGGLYHIDPLDQPGVEGGKIAAFALMGRPGYEDKAAAIRAGLGRDERYIS